jgi:hypothetical protein
MAVPMPGAQSVLKLPEPTPGSLSVNGSASTVSVLLILVAFAQRIYELFARHGGAGTAAAVLTLVVSAVAVAAIPFVWNRSLYAHVFALAALAVPCLTSTLSISDTGDYINIDYVHKFDVGDFVMLAIAWLALVVIVVLVNAAWHRRIQHPIA